MILFHYSPKKNRLSIWINGLEVGRARTTKKVLWFWAKGKEKWARGRVAAHHAIAEGGLDLWQVDVRPEDVRCWRSGIYVSVEDVHAKLSLVQGGRAYARRPNLLCPRDNEDTRSYRRRCGFLVPAGRGRSRKNSD